MVNEEMKKILSLIMFCFFLLCSCSNEKESYNMYEQYYGLTWNMSCEDVLKELESPNHGYGYERYFSEMIYGYTDDLFGNTGLHAQEVYEFKDDQLKAIVIGIEGLPYNLIEESYENICNIYTSKFGAPDINAEEDFYARWITDYSGVTVMIEEGNIIIGMDQNKTTVENH